MNTHLLVTFLFVVAKIADKKQLREGGLYVLRGCGRQTFVVGKAWNMMEGKRVRQLMTTSP